MPKIIIGNWKCNPATLSQAKKLFSEIAKKASSVKSAETVVCPPSAYLGFLTGKGSKVKLGSQNCYWEEKGAFTGELAALMVKTCNCKYVLIGHSERRNIFKETDGEINKKLRAALKVGLVAVLCVGETQEQRSAGRTEEILKNQLTSDLKDISQSDFSKIVVAYEPVWAIGTGNPCDTEEAERMNLSVRKMISEIYSSKTAEGLKILYGGSVNSKNSAGYLKDAHFDGLLVGGASLDSVEFGAILKTV